MVAEPDHLPAVDQHGLAVQGRQLDVQRRVRPQLRRHRQHRDALRHQRGARRGVRVLPQRQARRPQLLQCRAGAAVAVQAQPVRRQRRRADREEPDVLLRQLRGAAPAAGHRRQQRRAPRRRARGGHRSGLAESAGAHPDGRPASGPGAKAASSARPRRRSTSTRARATSPTSSGENDTLHGYYAFQARRARRADAAAQHDPGIRRHAASRRGRLERSTTRTSSGRSLVNEARFGFNRIHITFMPNTPLNPAELRHQQRRHHAARPAADHHHRASASTSAGPRRLPAGPHRPDLRAVRHRQLPARTARDQGRRRVPAVQQRQLHLRHGHVHVPDRRGLSGGTRQASSAITLGDRPSDITQQAARAVRPGQPAPDVATCCSSWACATTPTSRRPTARIGSWSSTRRPRRWCAWAATAATRSTRPATTSARASASSGTRSRTARPRCAARMPSPIDQPVTNVVTPTTANPPLAVPVAFAGADPTRQRHHDGAGVGPCAGIGESGLQGRPDAELERERRAPDRLGDWA